MPLKTEEEPQIEFGPEEELCIKAWNALDHLHGRNGSSLEVIGERSPKMFQPATSRSIL